MSYLNKLIKNKEVPFSERTFPRKKSDVKTTNFKFSF